MRPPRASQRLVVERVGGFVQSSLSTKTGRLHEVAGSSLVP
jgi:hypothetical protein